MKFLSIVVLLFVTSTASANEAFKGLSVYPFVYVRHFELQPETHDGNLDYFALSKSYKRNDWNFGNGFGTFIDTYYERALFVFTDISHDNYNYGSFKPVLNLHCAYKGHSYNEPGRKLQCYPLFKLRIGKEKGLFTNIIPIPKVGDVTNGLVAFEVGYKF